MKIFVFNGKKATLIILTIVLIGCFLYFGVSTCSNVISVFSVKRDLPIYYVNTAEKEASITFDCAWGPDDIPDIIKTLKKEDVKATFFILGQWAEKYPGTVKLIAENGHDIANHSYSHLRMGALDTARIRQEISSCDKKLSKISGKKVDLFRPPYGDYSNEVVGIARELGYFTVQWNVDSLDWKPGISQQEILGRINSRIKPGSIILFHNDTVHTAKLLPSIISSLKKDGYRLVPVSQLILRKDFTIDVDGRQVKK
jgi:peptidoglycan-N-acetylglucosamine deacetylase